MSSIKGTKTEQNLLKAFAGKLVLVTLFLPA